jgi:hypothetical protein
MTGGRNLKSTLFIFFLLVIVSCGKGDVQQEAAGCGMVCEVDEFSIPFSGEGALPAEALSFQTNLALLNFGPVQSAKVLEAAELVKKVIATEAFRTAVLNHSWNGQRQFANNNGLTNLQIYERILHGAEMLFRLKNNTMDVELELYYANTNVIGYTYPSSTRIWMNTKYFDSYTPVSVAANLVHEWLHKLGFGHDSAATPQRPFSVPYGVGSIIRAQARNFYTP